MTDDKNLLTNNIMCDVYIYGLYSCYNEFHIGIIGKWDRIIGTSV